MRTEIPVPWPTRWPLVAAKWVLKRVERPPATTDGIVTAFRDGQVTLRSKRRTEGFTNAVQEVGYQGIRRGDLVIHGMDAFAGTVGVSDSDGKASPVVHAYVSRGEADVRYYAYLLRMLAWSGFIVSLAKGIRERSTAFDASTFQSLVLPVPTLSEQVAIADYLDAESSRMDALIDKKRKAMSLVAERFRAFVARTTSDGPHIRVRRVTSMRTSGPRGWSELVGDEGDPFIRSANLQKSDVSIRTNGLARVRAPKNGEAVRSRTQPGDVLIGITGANTGWVGFVPVNLAGGFVSQHVGLLRPSGVEPEWLAYALFAQQAQDQLLGGQYGGTKQQLGLEDLADLEIAVPEQRVQRERISTLEAARENSELYIAALGSQIELLGEHHRALITAAVTGEVDMPGVVA